MYSLRLSKSKSLSSIETSGIVSNLSTKTSSYIPEKEPSETSDLYTIEETFSQINGSQAPEARLWTQLLG